MFKKKILLIISISQILAVILEGCGQSINTANPIIDEPAAKPTTALTSVVTTPTVTPKITNTHLAIIIPTLQPTIPITESSWEYNWLKGIPCKPPCWENIVPGKTTAKEMVDTLSKNQFMKNVQIHNDNNFGFSYIDWSWVDTIRPPFGDGYNNGGQARFKVSDNQQVIIHIWPMFEHLGMKLNFSKIISAYGQPEDVILIYDNTPNEGSGFKYNLSVLWTKLGFKFMFYSKTKGEIDKLFSGSDIVFEAGSEFFVPGQEGYLLNYPSYTKDIFVSWQGFKGFDYYCRKLPTKEKAPDCI